VQQSQSFLIKYIICCFCCYMFRPHMDHHQATLIIWGDHCTVHLYLRYSATVIYAVSITIHNIIFQHPVVLGHHFLFVKYSQIVEYRVFNTKMQLVFVCLPQGAGGSVVGSGTMLQAGRSRVRFRKTYSRFFRQGMTSQKLWMDFKINCTRPIVLKSLEIILELLVFH
jgi:hypothetical protein